MIRLPHMLISYMKDNEGIKERVVFKTEVEKKSLDDYDVVIDILNGNIVKSNFPVENQENFISEYMKKYSDQIVEIVRTFFYHNKDYLKYLQEVASSLTNEISEN